MCRIPPLYIVYHRDQGSFGEMLEYDIFASFSKKKARKVFKEQRRKLLRQIFDDGRFDVEYEQFCELSHSDQQWYWRQVPIFFGAHVLDEYDNTAEFEKWGRGE